MFTFTAPASFRILHRSGPAERAVHFHTARRPSLLDPRLDGDAHIARRGDDCLDVFVGHLRLATLRCTRLDWMTFNNLLFRIRG